MNINKIIESLSPIERKILPYIGSKNITKISEKSNLDKASVMRALEFLSNKKIIKLSYSLKKFYDLGVNGILYKRKGLPERRLLEVVLEKKIIDLKKAKQISGLSDDEFKAALGVLKKKAMIKIENKKIIFNSTAEEVSKKTLEEKLIETLPLDTDKVTPEQKYAIDSLKNRKEIINLIEKKEVEITLTNLGKEILNYEFEDENFIEQLTPEILSKDSNWKSKKFRRYDVESPVPDIFGGKRHFVNQAIDYVKSIWIEMGFKEMTGNIVETSFWVFDALFTPQDHPAREMQDTFFLDKKREVENKKILKAVKECHEKGVSGSKGWRYEWSEEEAKTLVLRTHTTCLSALTLASLKKSDLPSKFFAVGKVMRNETIDWKHGFDFYQTEGIVVDKNANFRHLLGYLKQFYKKMGFEEVRFRPGYFPYTEPSVEVEAWHPEKKQWLELGGAGIFRPEISVPLLGENIPVLAWGQGFDRIIMDYYNIKDLRELYKNNLTQLRKIKFWIK